MDNQLTIISGRSTVTMSVFTELQQLFIKLMVTGLYDQSECARLAGYGTGYKVRACELMARADIIMAIAFFCKLKFVGMIGKAIKVSEDILENGSDTAKVRVIKEIFDRTYGPVGSKNEKDNVPNVEDYLGILDREKDAQIDTLKETAIDHTTIPSEKQLRNEKTGEMNGYLAKMSQEFADRHPI